MPFIHGTAAGKVDHSHFLNFRAEHYWVSPTFVQKHPTKEMQAGVESLDLDSQRIAGNAQE
jgi:hypothetical protein